MADTMKPKSRRLVQRRRRWEKERAAAEAATVATDATLDPEVPIGNAEPTAPVSEPLGSGVDPKQSATSVTIPDQPAKDAQIERRALREGWDAPAKYRPAMVDRQITIAIDPKTPDKESTSAFRAVLAADIAQWERDHPNAKVPQINVNVQPITVVEIVRPQPILEVRLNGHADESALRN